MCAIVYDSARDDKRIPLSVLKGDKEKVEELKVTIEGDKLMITDKKQTMVLARK